MFALLGKLKFIEIAKDWSEFICEGTPEMEKLEEGLGVGEGVEVEIGVGDGEGDESELHADGFVGVLLVVHDPPSGILLYVFPWIAEV